MQISLDFLVICWHFISLKPQYIKLFASSFWAISELVTQLCGSFQGQLSELRFFIHHKWSYDVDEQNGQPKKFGRRYKTWHNQTSILMNHYPSTKYTFLILSTTLQLIYWKYFFLLNTTPERFNFIVVVHKGSLQGNLSCFISYTNPSIPQNFPPSSTVHWYYYVISVLCLYSLPVPVF